LSDFNQANNISVPVLKTVKQIATYPRLSHALHYIDSRAPPIKFQFLLRLNRIVWPRRTANNTRWHLKILTRLLTGASKS
jgi:hypothetical protein